MSALVEFGDRKLVTVKEVAYALRVCRRTLEREVARGKFPRPLKIGAKSLYRTTDIEHYLAKLEGRRESPQ